MHDTSGIEQTIGVSFHRKDILIEALTHRSYLNENPSWELPHNERLEFLGDAVLELVVTENLYATYPLLDEGKLTNVRAALVNYVSLSKVARAIKLEDALLMSRGEAKDTGRARDVILANACEALLGALYLDHGYEAAATFIKKHILILADDIVVNQSFKDAKSYFQELAQEKHKVTPTYKVLEATGPDHNKTFVVGVFLKDKKIAEGKGYSKQEAETEAAKNGLQAMGE